MLLSCSAKRYLPEGERYFAGHVVEYDPDFERVPRTLQNQIEDDLKPNAVGKVLGSRQSVWLYNIAGTPKKEKGFKHWLKYKMGDEPVYVSDVKLTRNKNFIEGFLRSEGFLWTEVTTRIDSSKYEAKVVYMVNQGTPYRVTEVTSCTSDSVLCPEVNELLQKGPIQPGILFGKTALDKERTRLSNHFRSAGYFYYKTDILRFQADSTGGNHSIRLRTALMDPLPEGSTNIYTLGKITADFTMRSDTVQLYRSDIDILVDALDPYVNPEKIRPFITMKPGQPYSLSEQRITLRQLNRLDIFSFVNLSYTSDTLDGKYYLNADFLATPLKRQSISTELNVSTTSTKFTGPGTKIEYNHRNIFRGGEKLRLSAVARYETQLSGSQRGLSAFEIDMQASLLLPRAAGFFLVSNTKGNVPRARYTAQYRLYKQPQFYAQSAAGLSFGYEWVGGEEHFHDLKVVSLDYLRLLETSPELEELLVLNPLLRESFENQVIFGPAYQYTYAPALKPGRRINWFFRGAIDLAGNTLYLGNKVIDAETDANGQYTLGSVPFSQYARIQTDPRMMIKTGRESELVLRQNINVGISYLNSNNLPFARQFFVGGAQSMRAFQPRGLGPGTYVNPNRDPNSFFDQTGDMLIEWNAEYRFGMKGYFQGAVFTDIGNVWLLRPNDERPGGEFNFDTFASQLAVAFGVGLRIDLSVLILRFDLATPLRKPYLPEGERWVADKASLSSDWRRENLVLNIAIGYPFY